MDDVSHDKAIDEGQDGRVQPVGEALRATFRADNHDSLSTDLTGLMIDLSRVPFDASDEIGPPPRLPLVTIPPINIHEAQPATKAGLLARLASLFHPR
jgi:hypothetical protein